MIPALRPAALSPWPPRRLRDEHPHEFGSAGGSPTSHSGQTAVFVGSSGAGKSSLINGLLNDARNQCATFARTARAGIRRPRAR
jgi:GTP-binding protein EngB required for normal cell division